MLKCSHCQSENLDDAQFCANCGNRLTAADLARGVAPTPQGAGPAPTADEAPPGTEQPEAVASVEEKNAAAMRLVAEGKVSEALEELNEAIRMAPNNAQFYLNRADVLARLGMMSQAEADRRMAQQLAPATRPPMAPAAGTTVCSSCGQSAAADARFCPGCGRVQSGVVYAGFWMRFLAVFIDGLILLIPYIILSAAAGGDLAVTLVLQIALGLAYVVGFWTAKGATPGKMVMGVAITKSNGEEIGFGTALLRYVSYLVPWIIPLIGLIGVLMIAFTPQKRGLYDYIAGTVVIKTR